MHEYTYITAFAAGLLGGVHCVGMCGGIVGALGFAAQQEKNASTSGLLKLLSGYNSGRLFSYTLAGGLMGGIGWLVSVWTELQLMQQLLQLTAAIFMLLMGLYISGWWTGLSRLEKVGAVLWRYIQPVASKLLPVSTFSQAFLLGTLWGWLPCGLVYSVLVWSVSTGSAIEGALLMLSFGAGTLPNLMAMGLFANKLKAFVQQRGVRYFAGGMVICFALWNLWLVYSAV